MCFFKKPLTNKLRIVARGGNAVLGRINRDTRIALAERALGAGDIAGAIIRSISFKETGE